MEKKIKTPNRSLLNVLILLIGLIIINPLVRLFPESINIPFLTVYSPHLRLQFYSLLFYLLIISVVIFLNRYPKFMHDKRSTAWAFFILAVFFVSLRILFFQHTIYSNGAADEGAFVTYYHNIGKAVFNNMSALTHPTPSGLLDLTKEMWKGCYGEHVTAPYPVSYSFIGISGIVMNLLISGAGYPGYLTNQFYEFGRIIFPLLGLIFACLLITFARKYVFKNKEMWPVYLLFFILCVVPEHIFMGVAIHYNIVADLLLVGMILLAFDFLETWTQEENFYISSGCKEMSFDILKTLFRKAIAFSICFGLLMGSKYVFQTGIFILLFAYVCLIVKFVLRNREGRAAYFITLSFFVFSMIAGGVLLYLILVSKNFFHNPKLFVDGLLLIVTNTAFLPSNLSLFARLHTLYDLIIIPNIGYVNATAGTIGFAAFLIYVFRKKDPILIMAAIWSGLIAMQPLVVHVCLLDHGSMTRNTILIGLFLLYSVYFLTLVVEFIRSRVKPAAFCFIKYSLILIFTLEPVLAGGSFLIFATHRSPRVMAQDYIVNNTDRQDSFATMRNPVHFWYPFYPQYMNRIFTLDKTPERYDLIATEDGAMKLIAKDNADYWMVSSHDPCFMNNKDEDFNNLKQALVKSGYSLVGHFYSKPFNNIPKLQRLYDYYITKLLSTTSTAGMWSPAYFDLYKKGNQR